MLDRAVKRHVIGSHPAFAQHFLLQQAGVSFFRLLLPLQITDDRVGDHGAVAFDGAGF